MSRELNDILASLPEDQRQRVEARAEELRKEVESARVLRANSSAYRMSDQAWKAFAELHELGAPVMDRSELGAEFVMSAEGQYNKDGDAFACYWRDPQIDPEVEAIIQKHGLRWEWHNPGLIGVYPADGAEVESQRDPARFDWSRVDGMSDAEIEAAARRDPDCYPWDEDEAQKIVYVRPATIRLRVMQMAPFLPAPETITAILALRQRGLPLLEAKRAIEAALLAETTITLPMVESFENLSTELADARFHVERVEQAS